MEARQRGRQAAVDAGAEAANGGRRDGEQRLVGAGVLVGGSGTVEQAGVGCTSWRAAGKRAGEKAE